MHNARGADRLLENEVLQHPRRDVEMANPGKGLRGGCKADRRAHFHGHRAPESWHALLQFLHDPRKQLEPFGNARLRKALEGTPRGGNRGIDIGLGPYGDFCAGLLGRRRDHLVPCAAEAFDPLAVNIMLKIAVHGDSPYTRFI
jgi:hypothetical protein